MMHTRTPFVAIGALLVLAGCGVPPQTQTSPASTRPEVSAPPAMSASEAATPSNITPTTPAEVLGKAETHKLRIVTTDGFKQSAVLTLYPGVAGRSTDQLEAGWRSVGGEGAVPCDSAMMSTGVVKYEFDREKTYYVFGTLRLVNNTTDFEPKQIGWSWLSGSSAESGLSNPGVLGLGYSDGAQCDTLTGTQSMMVPHWTKNDWGPIPVVIGVTDVFTPKKPKGDRTRINTFLFGVMATRFPGTVTIDGQSESGLQRPWLHVPGPSSVSYQS
jgi:hypothetical protein